MRERWAVGFAVVCVVVISSPPVLAAHNPPAATHYFSRINSHHRDPAGMDVLIVPPGYFSLTPLFNTGWVGANALYNYPGTQAILEATEYWAWMIDQYEAQYPQLAFFTWETRVLGVDAEIDDINDFEIVITTAMVGDAAPFIFHLGLGQPLFPVGAATGASGQSPMQICSTWLTGFGSDWSSDIDPLRLRNLAIHEFGHCLAAGHTGDEGTAEQICIHGQCYTAPHGGTVNEDVMSEVHGAKRQCLSNLNIQSLAEAYDFLPGIWNSHDGETYMVKTDYVQTCMPSGMFRF